MDHDEAATLRPPPPPRHEAASEEGVTLTVLAHPDLERVGEMAVVSFDGTTPQPVSRVTPRFSERDGVPRPLADRVLSRSPLLLTRSSRASVELRVSRDDLEVRVDGDPLRSSMSCSIAELEAGVTVALAGRVLLRLEAGQRLPVPRSRHGLVGVSRAMEAVREDIDRLAGSAEPVLLRGETGTGKELVARALHAASPRSDGPLVTVNLAAIPASTAASQLFGHARGAFTGAHATSGGLFGQAEGGSLFLDELGEASADLQPLLLRALERREVQPIGGAVRQVDVRLITATDASLEQLVADGRFRRALYHRVATSELAIPPLRTRPADIAVQLVAFLRAAMQARGALERLEPPEGSLAPWLGAALVEELVLGAWPGNSRQLRAFAEDLAVRQADQSAAALTDTWRARLSAAPATTLPPASAPVAPSRSQPSGLLGAADLRAALRRHGYRVEPTAKALGIAKNTLYARMAAAGIPRADDVTDEAIARARLEHGGDIARMAEQLEISAAGLRRRLRQLDAS